MSSLQTPVRMLPNRLVAIGDVHGCLGALTQLLREIGPRAGDHLVFVGDYVDRGPDSAEVLDKLILLARGASDGGYDVTFLRGNHEQMMLDARDGGTGDLQLWLRNGGRTTLDSYAARLPQSEAWIGRPWATIVAEDHWRFIEATKLHLVVGRYVFVHGGLDPSLSPGQNLLRPNLTALLWERRHLEAGADLSAWRGSVVVCGHTIQAEPLNLPELVCIDTGAFLPYVTGRPGGLTAVVLPLVDGGEREFITVATGA